MEFEDELKTEGNAKFYIRNPQNQEGMKISKKMPIFYNETMILNRDLTILVIDVFAELIGEKVTIMDTMAASGVRSIRLLLDTDVIKKAYINDLNPLAVRYIQKSMELNDISPDKYELFNEDANYLMERFRYRKSDIDDNNIDRFCDIIDIDPFGSPSRFISSAFKSIQLGGLLCVTATDTPVLFGIKKKQCIRKYITIPIKTHYLKEMGTRILIYYIMKIAHIYGYYIKPVLSISSDHFIRVFLIIYKGKQGIYKNLKNCGSYIHCESCGYRNIVKLKPRRSNIPDNICPICKEMLIKSGIVWFGSLHDEIYQSKVEEKLLQEHGKMFRSKKRILRYLHRSKYENNFPPFFYAIPRVADSIDSVFPSMDEIIEKLKNKGYNAARTHFDPSGIKSDANIEIIKEILRKSSIK
ncbi:MAG: tRNA (guanine(10)-N(2))-dimethyltransferase [Candidatus Lokiarchaeota archaeon]|nr:tRNA (guanine(10)-N(2))-dimethyltransferase [Candidatus Lokiarchaeota archaeon]